MIRHTYLSMSRHGVYYFRVVLPKGMTARTGRREIRISLRTKDCATAKVLVAREALSLIETLSQLQTRETGDHARPEPHHPDLAPCEQYSEVGRDARQGRPGSLTSLKFGTAYSHAGIKRPYRRAPLTDPPNPGRRPSVEPNLSVPKP